MHTDVRLSSDPDTLWISCLGFPPRGDQMSIRSRIAAVLDYLKNYRSHFRKRHLLYAFLLIDLVFVISSRVQDMYAFWDDDAERGATTVSQDVFGDQFTRVAYLDQNW